MRAGIIGIALVALSLSTGCGVRGKQPLVASLLSDDAQRAQALEATLRVLDENPQYVDEFFVRARQHPKTLNRFLDTAVASLEKDDELTQRMAAIIAAHPGSLRNVMNFAVQETMKRAEARAALLAAVQDVSPQLTSLLMQNPKTLRKVAGDAAKVVTKESREVLLDLFKAGPDDAGKK